MGFMDRVRLNNLIGMANSVYDADDDELDEMQNGEQEDESEDEGYGDDGYGMDGYDGGQGGMAEDGQDEQSGSDEEEEDPAVAEKAKKERQWKKDKIKMEIVASLFLARPAKQFKCPRCKRPSIYFEPDIIRTAMDSAWSSVYLPRTQRWVCFNPSCPMNFVKTRTRFCLGMIGNLVPTHIFSNVVDKNPFMPI